ncbi:YcaO-like family protein [Roseibium algae]|uniref:YcaO-like family protein n=1 Tax=Roseibium algae TaxID=3123038 RepID=A0ABU8TJR8_9HYPH
MRDENSRRGAFCDLAEGLRRSGGQSCFGGVEASTREAMQSLCAWGVAEIDEAGFHLQPSWSVERLELFAPLLDMADLKIRDTSLPGCPVVLMAALADVPGPEWNETERSAVKLVSGGQGLDGGKALTSCLGEMAERLSLFSFGGHDPRVHIRKNSACETVAEAALGELLGFSARQEQDMTQTHPSLSDHLRDGQLDWNRIDERYVDLTDIRTGERVQAPAYGVLMGEGSGLGLGGLSLTSTCGTAVWSTWEGALRGAVQELVERDAVGQLWYNRLGITCLERPFWPGFIHRNCCQYLDERERRTRFFIVDTDFRCHVVIAISHERDGLGACFGASVGCSVADAAQSALGEMLQGEQSLGAMVRAHLSGNLDDSLPSAVRYASTMRIADDLDFAAARSVDAVRLDLEFGEDELLNSCQENSIQLLAFDATRPDLKIPCVKVLSPDLCSWEPRFGKRRLYEGVVRRGWAQSEADEGLFRARPFPF